MTKPVSKSYFGKVILLMLLSIVFFLGLKAILPEHLFPKQEITANNHIILDDMMIEAINDNKENSVPVEEELGEPTPDNTTVVVVNTISKEMTDDTESLDPTLSKSGYKNLNTFYTKLRKLESSKKGKIRIAYFGDSMTDGDLIVQDIRQDLQTSFGGEGVGFVAITSLSASGRYSVSHQFSKNWKTQSFLNRKKNFSSFGISGQVFIANDTTQTYWVRYKAQGIKHSTQLYNPVLFFGKSSNNRGFITIKYGDKDETIKQLSSAQLLNTINLTDHNNPQSLKINFNKIDSIPFYGVNFDNGRGIHVDNFSLRGNSGLPLSVLNVRLMNAFDKILGYDLIILQYGANVLSESVQSYAWYERKMESVVKNLRMCFPNADILIISTADKATKIDETMQTIPVLQSLLRAQMNYARTTDAGFINLYSLMGGSGSMVTWADKNWAGKDYTHFTALGAKKAAKLIHKELIKGFELFKINNPEETEKMELTDLETSITVENK